MYPRHPSPLPIICQLRLIYSVEGGGGLHMLLTKRHTLVVSECLVLGWINLKPRHNLNVVYTTAFNCSSYVKTLHKEDCIMLACYRKCHAIHVKIYIIFKNCHFTFYFLTMALGNFTHINDYNTKLICQLYLKQLLTHLNNNNNAVYSCTCSFLKFEEKSMLET